MATPRALALGGVLAPVLFAMAVVVSAELRPDYSHYSQFMSELGETGGRSATVMNFAGFFSTGLLVFLASVALFSSFGATWVGALGAACFSAAGLGMFASGIFSCDLSCTPDTPTRAQQLHDIAGAITFPALVSAPLILGLRFRKLDEWRSMFPYSVLTTILGLFAVIALVWSVPERSGTGVFQRLVLGLSLVWLAIVSWRMWTGAAMTAPRFAFRKS